MRSNYKKLENFIEFFDSIALNHESDLDLDSIKGISSISKDFIKTKANLVGVVSDNYKVVEKDSFAYNPNTARMGDKIPIALNQSELPVLVSSIYPTFKIKDSDKLLPEYLLMWFRRPEFDRYARFKSHGSAREIFDWEQMTEVEIAVPPIEKQREIVAEYNTIQNRIDLNKKLIQKLEETAQAIYKEWFVNEIDLEDLPEGWRVGKLSDIATIIMGQSPEGETYNKEGNGMIFYQGRTDFGYRFPDITTYTTQPKKKALKNDILISVRAPVGDLNIAIKDCAIGRGIGALRSKLKCNSHLFYTLQNLKSHFDISDGEGTIFGSINKDDLHNLEIVYSENLIKDFDEIAQPLDNCIKNCSIQNQKLIEMKELLLSKLATIEN